MGGALADPVDGGVLVFAGGAEVAASFAEQDPYVLKGIVESWSVREWSVVVGGGVVGGGGVGVAKRRKGVRGK